jgi:hypothetical protein
VIGIHTHAGCNTGGGSNQGTSIERPDIEDARAASEPRSRLGSCGRHSPGVHCRPEVRR